MLYNNYKFWSNNVPVKPLMVDISFITVTLQEFEASASLVWSLCSGQKPTEIQLGLSHATTTKSSR